MPETALRADWGWQPVQSTSSCLAGTGSTGARQRLSGRQDQSGKWQEDGSFLAAGEQGTIGDSKTQSRSSCVVSAGLSSRGCQKLCVGDWEQEVGESSSVVAANETACEVAEWRGHGDLCKRSLFGDAWPGGKLQGELA